MIKRILLVLLALIPCFAQAQLAVGGWKIYSPFVGSSIGKMVETPQKLYFISEGSLYSYDKETGENYSYNSINKLNDNNITDIYYNKTNKYLLIAYESGNIDLLYNDGKLVNMPDVKDAILTSAKTINDVSFSDNRIYVATNFGLVIFNDQKHEVIESGIYNKDVVCIDVIGNHILMCCDKTMYISDVDQRHNMFDSFSVIEGVGSYSFSEVEAVNENKVLVRIQWGQSHVLWMLDLDLENKIYVGKQDLSLSGNLVLNESKDCIYSYNATSLLIADSEANITTLSLPADIQSHSIALWDDVNTVWACNVKGLGHYTITDGTLTVLQDKFKPESITVKNVVFLNVGKSGKIYLSNTAASNYLGWDAYQRSQVNTVQNGVVEDVTILAPYAKNNKNNPGASFMYDTYDLCEDPDDPDTYYVGTYWEGIYKVTNRDGNVKYDWTNSTITQNPGTWACHVPCVEIDREGNLWALNWVSNSTKSVLNMLPAASRKKSETTAADWTGISVGDFLGNKDARMLICEKSNMIIMSNGYYTLVGYDTKGTYTDTSDDTFLVWNKYTDQDNKSFVPGRISAITEDENGQIWIGTDLGVISVANAYDFLNGSMNINRVKVPRNDGTTFADYLLDNQHVLSIAIDSSNRKWMSTKSNGIYLVSENGSEILEHFTVENSDLPSNKVYSVACDPNSNSVFIGTDVGLVEYSSSSSPAMDDYSNVYAYPNPVRPDYTGWITIKGLMENSLVKIADSAGNVFYSGRSEGGMMTWDGCNSSGERVKTGVYYVFASQNENEESSGVVTKILVVN